MLEFAGVGKSFDGARPVHVLQGVDFSIGSGEFVSLVGHSGSGKTTLLRLAAGLLRPTAGTVSITGTPANLYAQSHSIGYMSQTPALLEWRTLEENLKLPAEISGNWNGVDRRIAELLDMFGLSEYGAYFPRELSGGMAQRAAMARALLCEAPILLLDEPFSSLDALTRESLWRDAGRTLMHEGVTGFMITHNISEAVVMSDRILVLGGRPARVVGELDVPGSRPRDSSFLRGVEARETEQAVRELLEAHLNSGVS